MNKITKKIIVFILVIAAGALVIKLWAQTCQTARRSFAENFDTTNFKDAQNSPIANWPSGPIELPRLGANFAITQPGGLGAHIYVCDAGDFTGDGYPDFVGLDLTGPSGNVQSTSRLMLVRNWYPTTHVADFRADATKVFDTFNTYTAPASITVADYNGDGRLDFFFMKNGADQFGYTNFMAIMYINHGTTSDPIFDPYYNTSYNLNFSARFQTAGIYINWAATHLSSVDIDRDGDMDILVISQDKIFLVRNPGVAGAPDINQWSVGELSYDQGTGFQWTGGGGFTDRGGSCVSAVDFDNDGDIDIVGGTVNNFDYLVYYENDGQGSFTRQEIAIPNPACTGAVGISARDFNNDGFPDIFGATDAWNTGNQAHIWIMLNRGVTQTQVPSSDPPEYTNVINWEFRCLNSCQPIIPPAYDTDIVAPVDYDQDGDIDIVLADANHSGDYYLVINMLADVFALNGQAQSTNIAAGILDPHLYAVTRVRLSLLTQRWRGQSSSGLRVELYFSSNGGVNWELYSPTDGAHIGRWTGSEIATVTNAANVGWYNFNNFGADLRWRIVLTAPEDPMQEYTGASFDTPSISDISVEYEYVSRLEYSRASAAATIVTRSGETKKLIIGSSFIYPGWEGQLRAYDVTQLRVTGNAFSALSTVTASDLGSPTGRTLATGTEIFWDAGTLLRDRSPDGRAIYTAIRANRVLTNPLQRINFTTANVTTLATFLQDTNNNNSGLISFIRGQDRTWKLNDINHSTPIVVGPPDGDPVLMGSGYDTFKQYWENRSKVIYVGANDGMLHCFSLETGDELWGFVPYNLLPKLTNQWRMDTTNNMRYYFHDIYVDGSPSVADVYYSGGWHTVLLCGQGPGRGNTMASGFAGGVNFYFALDITDPTDPQPLWEISHSVRQGNQTLGTMGETWSVPAIGKINDQGTDRWVAFMGSGYNNTGQSTTGRYFYVVRADNGEVIRNVNVTNVDTSSLSGARFSYRYSNIPVAIVASPTALDSNDDGRVESVYVGDLDGRLYKMDMTSSNRNWSLSTMYTDYLYYPIITKPAVWIDPFATPRTPRVFFGTGGDEGAPSTRDYSFVCVQDTTSPMVEWFIGNPTTLNLAVSLRVGDSGGLGTGYKVWADPVVADYTVYFSTLQGSIENVNPCVNLGTGLLYARNIRAGLSGMVAGASAFKSANVVPPEYLQMISKARRAVTLGEIARQGNINKREVFIQEYNSTIEMLEQPVMTSRLQIKSWREIYKIIR